MKRSLDEVAEVLHPSTRRVRFSADPALIRTVVLSGPTENSPWYSKEDLALFRLKAIKVSAQVQKQIPSKQINPFQTRHCDQCLTEGETVRGLERLINPYLGILRKQERDGVIKGALVAQALARKQKCVDENVNTQELIASFLRKETNNAKLIAQLVGKADQESAATVY